MCAFATLTGALTLETDEFSDGVSDAEGDLDTLTGKAASTGKSLQQSGAVMSGAVTAPLAAMGALAIDTSKTFEQSMANSLAVMGDVSDSMEADLEETARRVARETTVSASEAADSLYYLSSAGLDAAQAMEAMPTVTRFSEAAGDALNMAEATDIATNVMSAYGYEASEMGEVTDTLTAVTQNHNQTVNDMASAMSQVAPVASSLGISLEEASVATGMLGDQGISAERAGTGLRNIFSQLSDTSSTAAQELQNAGVQIQDAEGNMLPLTDILSEIEQSSLEASDATQIFGQEAGPAAAALIQQGSDALEENTDQIRESEGATVDMAEEMRSTTQGEMQQMRSDVEDVGLTIGSVLLPMLSTLTGYISGAAEWFQELNEEQQKAIVVVGGVAAALGPLLVLIGTILTMLPAMASGATMAAGAFGTLWTTLLGPVGLAIAAVIGLAAAWKTNFLNIQGHTENGVNAVIDLLNWMVGKINKILPDKWEIDFEGEEVDFATESGYGSGEEEEQDKSDYLPDGMSSGDLEGVNTEDLTGDQEGLEEAGTSAGQDFGTGFNEGVVESLETEQIAEEGISQIDSEIADLQSEIEQLSSGATSHSEWQQVADLESQISSLKDERKELQNAESITDFDSELVADVAQADLEDQREEAEQIESIYAELEEKGLDVEAPSNSTAADMASLQQDLDTPSSEIDAEEVDAILENNAESTSEGGKQGQHETLRKILQEIKSTRNALETLRLRVDMDLNSREFNKIMDNRAEAVVEEQIG